MRIKGRGKQERLDEVKELYGRAALAVSDKLADFDRYDRQYRGDGTMDARSDGDGMLPRKADAVWNISFELLEGSIDSSIPQPTVTPEFSCRHHVGNARRIEGLIRNILDKYQFELYNDAQERTVKKFGTSALNVEWDARRGSYSAAGDVVLTPLRPHAVYPQPGVTDIEACDHVFINYVTTRDDMKRRYRLSDGETALAELDCSFSDTDELIYDGDVVTLTVLWYRNDLGDICRFVYSGGLILEDEEDYYSRRLEYCRSCGRRRALCEHSPCASPKYYVKRLDADELTEDIVCSDGRIIPAFTPEYRNGKPVFEVVRIPVTLPDGSQAVGDDSEPLFMSVKAPKMKRTRLPFYRPRRLPVAIRYNIRDDNSFWGISDMEIIRENQQECNKLTSRIHEAIMRSGAVLMKPESSDIVLSNGVFDNVIGIGEGVDKNQFGLFSYSVDITQWLIERSNHKEQAKKLLGISDSFLGQSDSTATSGYAKSIQITQSSGRLASKKLMKQAHFADIFRIIFELYLAFADEPRQIRHESDDPIFDADERFNRYDFYEFDARTGEWFIDDGYSFSIDRNGALPQQYPQLWELIKGDYAAGLYGAPTDIRAQLCVWRHLERLRYPFARSIVELTEKQLAAQAQAQVAQAEQRQGQGQGQGQGQVRGEVGRGDADTVKAELNARGGRNGGKGN